MNILSLDTATEACSVALLVGDAMTQSYQVAPQQHASLLLPMIDKQLKDAGLSPRDLDGLVFGQGPGSFTGVRIATAAVQGIALGAASPVVGISTLAAVAHRAWREQGIEQCVASIDARMQQIYWGCYVTTEEGHTVLVGEEQVTDPGSVELPVTDLADQWLCVGTGAMQYAAELQAGGIRCQQPNEADASNGLTDNALLPTAVDMLLLARPVFAQGGAVSVEQVAPVYLRDKVALTEAERAAARTSGNIQ